MKIDENDLRFAVLIIFAGIIISSLLDFGKLGIALSILLAGIYLFKDFWGKKK